MTIQERIEQTDKMAQAMCGFCDENKRCILKDNTICNKVMCQDCGSKESAEMLIYVGYRNASEYIAENDKLKAEREMLGSQIKVLKQRLNDKYVEIDKLKTENYELTKKLEARLTCDFVKTAQKQAQIDVLNKAKERLNAVSRELGDECDYCGVSAVCSCRCNIDELIKEVQNEN